MRTRSRLLALGLLVALPAAAPSTPAHWEIVSGVGRLVVIQAASGGERVDTLDLSVARGNIGPATRLRALEGTRVVLRAPGSNAQLVLRGGEPDVELRMKRYPAGVMASKFERFRQRFWLAGVRPTLNPLWPGTGDTVFVGTAVVVLPSALIGAVHLELTSVPDGASLWTLRTEFDSDVIDTDALRSQLRDLQQESQIRNVRLGIRGLARDYSCDFFIAARSTEWTGLASLPEAAPDSATTLLDRAFVLAEGAQWGPAYLSAERAAWLLLDASADSLVENLRSRMESR